MKKRGTVMAFAAALSAATLIATGTAHADLKCREAMATASSKLTQAIAKTLQKCEQAVHDGKFAGPCPDSTAAGKITTAKSKFKATITGKCAGSTGEWTLGRCPNETGADANNCGSILINSKDDEADCLSCLADHNATELVHRVLYGFLTTGGGKDVAKCQKTVGGSTVKFYAAASKALGKCESALFKKKVAACPDQTTTDAINAAESKKIASITKDCCGPDGVCGGATCTTDPALLPKIECVGGANNGQACAADSACPGGTCINNGFKCAGGTNDGAACSNDSQCPSGRCWGGASGEPCEANRDCGRCRDGGSPGKPCSASGQCQSSASNCDTSAPKRCIGGAQDGRTCLVPADCDSGNCSATCVAGANAGAACTTNSECPGSACSTGTCQGGTNDGLACNPSPKVCQGGSNNGATCSANSECPGAVNGCTVRDCPAIASGTCVGTGTVCQGGANAGASCAADSQCPSSTCSGLCGGIDDLSPSTVIGLPVPCPGLTTNSSAIVQTGVSGVSLLDCVDTQSSDRAACQNAVGATSTDGGNIPTFCVDTAATCAISGGTQQVTVVLDLDPSFSDIGGVSVSLGYNGVAFPGIGNVTLGGGAGTTCPSNCNPLIGNNVDGVGQNAYFDDDAELTLSTATGSGGLVAGPLYHVTFSKCGTTPTPTNFGCVVRSASDDNAIDITDGVGCHVTLP